MRLYLCPSLIFKIYLTINEKGLSREKKNPARFGDVVILIGDAARRYYSRLSSRLTRRGLARCVKPVWV